MRYSYIITAIIGVAFLLLIIALGKIVKADTLVWDPSTGTVEGYIVEVAEGDDTNWVYGYITSDTQMGLDDKGQPGMGYFFRVRAYNGAGASAPCAAVKWTKGQFTPPTDLVPMPTYDPMPSAPVNPTITE